MLEMKLEVTVKEDPFVSLYPLVGRFVLRASSFEYALDDLLYQMSKIENDLLEQFRGGCFLKSPPSSYEDKVDLAIHFIANSANIMTISDREGPIDVEAWGKGLKDFLKFRNDVVHGSIDLLYSSDKGKLVRARKFPPSKKTPHRTYPILIENLENACGHFRYSRILLWEALEHLRKAHG